jgi:phage-related protein
MVKPVRYWWFYDFVQSGNPVQDWYSSELSDLGRFAMDAMLKNTAKVANQLDWGARDLGGTSNKKEDILELKFIADKKQYRLGFIFQPGRQVILLNGFYHQQKVYHPPNALDTARKRAKDFRENRASKIERTISFDI